MLFRSLQCVNRDPSSDEGVRLLIEYHEWLDKWWHRNRPSIHMPRWACRLFLEVKAVRVERLQDISEDDAKAEGCIDMGDSAGDEFAALWESINGKRGYGWTMNPYVWCIEFEKIDSAE